MEIHASVFPNEADSQTAGPADAVENMTEGGNEVLNGSFPDRGPDDKSLAQDVLADTASITGDEEKV